MPPDSTLITSRTNPRVKQLRAAFSNQARLSSGLIALEGEHLLKAALAAGQPIKTIFLTESLPIPSWLPRSIELVRLPGDIFASVTDTRTPQGIAALLIPPTHTLEPLLTHPRALILIAVALQDPGNLGTLIRSAEAFGATAVLTTPNTVNPWNQKSVRASAGSIFRLPIAQITPEDLTGSSLQILATVPTDATPIHQLDLTQPTAILIGNEGAGLPQDWLALATQTTTIPTPGPVESLNAAVAASILLYESSRQRTF